MNDQKKQSDEKKMDDGQRDESNASGKDNIGSGSNEKSSEIDDPFQEDIQLMESLFENDQKRAQRLLAVFDNHASPVNCVRWNNIGTLFASAADDGSVILWEFKGEKVVTAFERQQFSGFGKEDAGSLFGKPEDIKSQFNDQEEENKKEDLEVYEDWKAKKTWYGHKGGVSDLAWCPDNRHFASCGTDSQINIWNINEHQPVKTLEAKANGLTFDPFGKFMASQSSEDKNLIIWRVQNFKNITKEKEHTSFYKQSTAMSLFRRLSWSSDGTFISTTAGKIGTQYLAPLISRSSWDQLATLSGHNKAITVSRINPKLFKQPNLTKEIDYATGQEKENLACYSVVALASIDSTISIWKPYMTKPLAVVLDIFKMGITDMTWGFNGNILLGSSHDGIIMFIHFKPGVLGEPLTELEKQITIENKYGESILNEYKKHTKVQNSAIFNLSAQQKQTTNSGAQQQENKVVAGKKKIVPVMMQQYTDTKDINPQLNPFQQLKEIPKSQFQQNPKQFAKLPEIKKVESETSQTSSEMKLPSFNQTFRANTQNVAMKDDSKPLASENEDQKQSSSVQSSQIIQPPKPQQQQQQLPVLAPQQLQPPVVVAVAQQQQEESKQSQLEASGKKTQRTKKKKNDQVVPTDLFSDLMKPANPLNQQRQPISSTSVLGNIPKELALQIESIMLQTKDISAIPLEQYQSIIQIQDKDEIQFRLPSKDIFAEEIRLFINNYDINAFNRKAEIRILNTDNVVVSSDVIDREYVVLTSVNSSFYAFFTNAGQILIFSTRTLKNVKKGIYVEGLFMMDCNEQCSYLVGVTLKGGVYVYKVRNPDYPTIESVQLEWTASIADILRSRTQQALLEDPTSKQVYVKSLRIGNDGSVFIFLADNSRYEYDLGIKAWRQMSNMIEIPLSQSQDTSKQRSAVEKLKGKDQKQLSSIIKLLEEQSLESPEEKEMIPEQEVKLVQQNALSDAQSVKVNDLQETMGMYERLGMKNEFLYMMRQYTTLVISRGDMSKLKELMIDYKFTLNAEDESLADVKLQSQIHPTNAVQNLMALIAPPTEEEEEANNQSKLIGVKRSNKICGMEKREVFQYAILPVLKTLSEINGKQMREVFEEMVKIIVSSQSEGNQPTEQEVAQTQASEQLQQLQQEQLIQAIQIQEQLQQYIQPIQQLHPMPALANLMLYNMQGANPVHPADQYQVVWPPAFQSQLEQLQQQTLPKQQQHK